MPELRPNRDALAAFLNGLFLHADGGSYVNLRAFRDGADGPPLFVEAIRVDDPALVDRVEARAAEAANGQHPHCFCPPVATFKTANGAKLEDLREGLALSVECDQAPAAARAKLVELLGKPTMTVASGGEWLNAAVKRREPKLHLHWRLCQPARSAEEREQLREARELAATLVGADRSNISIVHPLRWPGSWHRKNPVQPRIAYIVDSTDNELALEAALAALQAACPQPRHSAPPPPEGGRTVPLEDVAAALAIIPGSDDRAQWIRIGEAAYAASGGAAFTAWDEWSRKAPSKYGGTEKAWASFAKSPPRRIGFGTLYKLAVEADPAWRPPSWGAAPNPFGEDGIAEAFAERQAERMRFVPAWGRWLAWTGAIWQSDERLQAFTHARAACRDAAQRARNEGNRSQLTSAKSVAGVVTLARTDPRLVAVAGQFDADLFELVIHRRSADAMAALSVDLRTGNGREPRPEDYNTKCARAPIVPAGTPCPLWVRFLTRVTDGNRELIDFLQRWCGYCLTGSTAEQVMVFLYGTGANGKSVFVSTVTDILGDYAAATSMEILLTSRQERHPTELARLMGVRLVTAHEIASGRRWDEEKIKLLTGGDKLTARFMRQDFFEFVPRFKLMVFGNHKPTLRNVDEAIRRRLLLVPFTVTIPERERDPDLLAKLKTEAGAILQWMIAGCLAWQRDGLKVPAAVRNASDAYFAAQNSFGEWVEEALCEAPGAWARTLDLFDVWKAWCEPRNLKPGSSKSFSEAMEEHGFVKRLEAGTKRAGFLDIALRSASARGT
jgi:putative DNA primase/helicase